MKAQKIQKEILTFSLTAWRVYLEDLFQEGSHTTSNCSVNQLCRQKGTQQSLLKFLGPTVSAGPANICLPNVSISMEIAFLPFEVPNHYLNILFFS